MPRLLVILGIRHGIVDEAVYINKILHLRIRQRVQVLDAQSSLLARIDIECVAATLQLRRKWRHLMLRRSRLPRPLLRSEKSCP